MRAAIATVDRDYADLRVESDVGTDEVVEIVLSVMPDIIHFSGHGEPGNAQLDNGTCRQKPSRTSSHKYRTSGASF